MGVLGQDFVHMIRATGRLSETLPSRLPITALQQQLRRASHPWPVSLAAWPLHKPDQDAHEHAHDQKPPEDQELPEGVPAMRLINGIHPCLLRVCRKASSQSSAFTFKLHADLFGMQVWHASWHNRDRASYVQKGACL